MSEMTQSFAELFEESLKTIDMKAGSIITGVVVDIDSEWVTVHAGLKSEGVIPRIQFLDESGELEVNIGDAVQVSMDAVDDGFGETRLSREKAKRAERYLGLSCHSKPVHQSSLVSLPVAPTVSEQEEEHDTLPHQRLLHHHGLDKEGHQLLDVVVQRRLV